MSASHLLRSQTNELFRAIEAHGLQPDEFEWGSPVNDQATSSMRLVHSPSKYFFEFIHFKLKHSARCAPHWSYAAELYLGEFAEWSRLVGAFGSWLERLKREYFEPDLWHLRAAETRLIVADVRQLDNAPFSSDEQARISKALAELRSFLVSTGGHSEVQLKFIETRLDHLEESSRRLGRKDWITLAMGTLLNIIVGAALAPEAARELLRNAGALLGWIANGIQLLN